MIYLLCCDFCIDWDFLSHNIIECQNIDIGPAFNPSGIAAHVHLQQASEPVKGRHGIFERLGISLGSLHYVFVLLHYIRLVVEIAVILRAFVAWLNFALGNRDYFLCFKQFSLF